MKRMAKRESKLIGFDVRPVGAELTEDRRKALNLAIAQIEKSCGKGSIMQIGADTHVKIESISTGALNLDAAIGIGGIPRGRITEIYGPEASGKTTLALHLAATAQRSGGVAAFIDAEHALDVEYAKKLGVDVEELLVSQPDTGEQALEIGDILVRSGAVDIIVVDSVAAIGVMFGNPETTTGGKALKFYASLRLDVRRIGAVKERDEIIGSRVRVKVVKNKVAPPFRMAEFDVMFNEGISHSGLLVDLGVEAGVIEKSGAWYSCGTERIGQGRENAKLYLKDNTEIAERVEREVKEFLGIIEPSKTPAEAVVEKSVDGPAPHEPAPHEPAPHEPDTTE